MNEKRILTINEENFTNYLVGARYGAGTKYDHVKSILYRYRASDHYPYIGKLVADITHKVPTSVMESHYNSLLSVTVNPTDSSILPLAVRYIDRNGSYYIERPPFKINVHYKDTRAMYSADHTKDLQIWVPWTITIIPQSFFRDRNPNFITIHYSHKSLESNKDIYLESFFPNSHTGGAVCWSSSFTKLLQNNPDIDKSPYNNNFDYTYWYSMIINDYFGGGWNTDLYSRGLDLLSCRQFTNRSYGVPSELQSLLIFEDQKLADLYPMYHKYIFPEKYSDLYHNMSQKIMDQFSYSIRRTKDIISTDKRHKISKFGGCPEFVKFFAFMSQLSLQQTLDFYSDMAKVGRKYFNSPYTKEFIYKDFKQLVSNQTSENSRATVNDVHDSYLLPLNTALQSDPKLYASSFSALAKYPFNVAIVNPKTENQIHILNDSPHYYSFWNMIEQLRFDPNQITRLLIEHIAAMQDSANPDPSILDKSFMVIDLQDRSITFRTHQDYRRFLADIRTDMSNDIQQLLQQHDQALLNSKKKKNTYHLPDGCIPTDFYRELKELTNNQQSLSDLLA